MKNEPIIFGVRSFALFAFAISLITVGSAHGQTVLDFSTTNPNNWVITAGNLVNAIPDEESDDIAITSNGSSPAFGGVPLPGLNLNDFDGFWTATNTFTLPNGATNITLNYSALNADDRVVLELNGTPVDATGGDSPGEGSMVFTDGGPLVPYYFDGPAGSVSGTVTSGFVIDGQNTLEAIINNTESGIFGNISPLYYATAFGVDGTVSYDTPEPREFLLLALGVFGLMFKRSRRVKLKWDIKENRYEIQ
jgi:hypothetical protein